MVIKFRAPSPWQSIKAAAQESRAYVAVPFLGKGAATMLPISSGSVLVTRFTQEAVKAGQVDPREVVKFIRSGVSVFSQADLHAKIYIFPRRIFVGSANVSKTSEGLMEACIETTEPSVVAQAREFVRSLASDLVTLEYAKSLIGMYPEDGERYLGVPKKTARERAADIERFWVSTVEDVSFTAEVRRADRVGSKIAKKVMTGGADTSLEKLLWHGLVPFRLGDWVLSRFKVGRGYKFDCPERVIHTESVPDSDDGASIIYLERIKKQGSLSSTELRASHKELVSKLCFPGDDEPRRLTSARDVAAVKQLWSAFRA